MTDDEWTIADTDTAPAILLYLGIGSEASREPFVDRRRDGIAKIIRARVEYEVAQEREGCAFAAECHSGIGDPATIEACATLIRARSDEPEDCIHVLKDVYARLISMPAAMTVKPLKWSFYEMQKTRGSVAWDAPSLVGPYTIEKYEDLPNFGPPDRPWFCHKLCEHFATPDEGKAAAQKDYEERLLSAFDLLPNNGAQA